MRKLILTGTVICILVLFLCPEICFSQSSTDPEETVETEGPGIHDAEELEVYVDGLMAAHFESYHLAGAVVAVVKDAELYFTKGYGYSDFENRIPVDPHSTLFRIASITKLFTWTAVMQLVEQGRLNPEADLNNYLRAFKIPSVYLEPIKMTHLMTHTPGFEDRVIGLFAKSPDQLVPLVEILSADLPSRIRPPGQIAAYSNHGSALAGYIVERLSGLKWEEYVRQNILSPLQMNASTVEQPVPVELRANLSGGYTWKKGQFRKEGFEYVPAAPAGGASATAGDMAKFMIAFLQDGRFGDRKILEPNTAERMLKTIFTHDPRLAGMSYGFINRRIGQFNALGHGGDTLFFHSILLLIPEHQTGIFLSYNSEQGARARKEFLKALLDRYFPLEAKISSTVLPGFSNRIVEVEGIYRTSRRVATTIGKIAELFSVVEVRSEKQGSIQTHHQSETERWNEVQPYVFQNIESQEKLIFKAEGPDERTLGFLENAPYMALERLRWWETPDFHLLLLLVSTLILITTIILPVATFLINLRSESLLARKLPSHPKSRTLAACVSILLLTFLAGLSIILSDPVEIVYGVPASLNGLLVLPIVASFLTTLLLVVTVSAWRSGYWSLVARIHYTFVFFASVALLWQLNYWNFLGWHY